jgi:hypothetical protein
MVDLREIEEVKEIDSVKEVNELLAEGWVLLNTYRKVSRDSDDQRLVYVLGSEALSPGTNVTTDVPGPSGGSVEGRPISNAGSPARIRPRKRKLRYKGPDGGTAEPCFIEYEDDEE